MLGRESLHLLLEGSSKETNLGDCSYDTPTPHRCKVSRRDEGEPHVVPDEDPLNFVCVHFPKYFGRLTDREHDVAGQVQCEIFTCGQKRVCQEACELINGVSGSLSSLFPFNMDSSSCPSFSLQLFLLQ